MSKELPWLKVKMSPANIETLDLEVVPEESGVYVMMSTRIEYTYPWSESKVWGESKGRGKSKVYYIGQARSLRRRLAEHKRNFKATLEKYDPTTIYWSRYEYATNHGCNIVWLVSRNPQDKERELLQDFASYYGAKPVANG